MNLLIHLANRNLLNWVPDIHYLKLIFYFEMGCKLNLSHPKTFSEKLQWLKIFHRKVEYSDYVDKYNVRFHISRTLGNDYLIPLIAVHESVEEIKWELLPNEFVLKCTHGSHANIFCVNKKSLNIDRAKSRLRYWMNKNWYWFGREYPYKFVKPRIICEKLLKEKNGNAYLTDYKIFCFNGKPKYCQIIKNRGQNDETIDFFDRYWNHMPFTGLRNLPRSAHHIDKPKNYELLFDLAEKISNEFLFVRVDFYCVGNDIFFGELTFFPTSGFGKFYPEEWNKSIGNLLILPFES